MTPKDLEDIRSWRRGEWVADITEIESMVYGLVDELDRLRAAAAALKQYVHDENNAGMLLRDLNHKTGNGQATKAMYCGSIEALTALLSRGCELGLWED